MTVLNETKRRVALIIGSASSDIPGYFMIGSGSGLTVATQTTLLHPTDRQAFTSTDTNTQYQVKWTGDWNSVEMSGLQLSEFGVTGSGAGTAGSMWTRTPIPAITFNGTNELRIESSIVVF